MNEVACNTVWITRLRLLGVFVSIVLLVLSCQTPSTDPTEFETSQLSGLVYDYAGQPIKDVIITLDDIPAAVSDVNGHFIFANVAKGEHSILAEGRDLESLKVDIEFRSRRDILYLRMYSLSNLLDKANAALLTLDFPQADLYLGRAEALSPLGPQVAYLRAIYLTKLGEPAAAFEAIETILQQRIYGAPVVQLLRQIVDRFPEQYNELERIVEKHPLLLSNRDFAMFLENLRKDHEENAE